MRNFCKRGIASVLLISLLLESCSDLYVGKREPVAEPASNKSSYLPDSEEHTESLPNPSLSTGEEEPSNEPDRANLALIEPIESLVSQRDALQAPGTAAFFESLDSRQENEP